MMGIFIETILEGIPDDNIPNKIRIQIKKQNEFNSVQRHGRV